MILIYELLAILVLPRLKSALEKSVARYIVCKFDLIPDIYRLDWMYAVNIQIGLDWVGKNGPISNPALLLAYTPMRNLRTDYRNRIETVFFRASLNRSEQDVQPHQYQHPWTHMTSRVLFFTGTRGPIQLSQLASQRRSTFRTRPVEIRIRSDVKPFFARRPKLVVVLVRHLYSASRSASNALIVPLRRKKMSFQRRSEAVGTPSRVPERVWKRVSFHRTRDGESPTTKRAATVSLDHQLLFGFKRMGD